MQDFLTTLLLENVTTRKFAEPIAKTIQSKTTPPRPTFSSEVITSQLEAKFPFSPGRLFSVFDVGGVWGEVRSSSRTHSSFFVGGGDCEAADAD
jgi:hypothetical protein